MHVKTYSYADMSCSETVTNKVSTNVMTSQFAAVIEALCKNICTPSTNIVHGLISQMDLILSPKTQDTLVFIINKKNFKLFPISSLLMSNYVVTPTHAVAIEYCTLMWQGSVMLTMFDQVLLFFSLC